MKFYQNLKDGRFDNILLRNDTGNSEMKTAPVKYWSEKGLAPVFIILGVALLAGAGFLAVNSQGILNKDFSNILNSPNSCANGWQDYTNKDFGYGFKIPAGWTDNSIDERQTEDISIRYLVSTLKPEEQLDPKFPISTFEIIASRNDLKLDPNYRDQFIYYPANSQRSQVTLHGLPAEYVGYDVTQPAGNLHVDQYYFNKNNIYYFFHLAIYTTPNLKAKNEAIEKCFVDKFRVIEPDEVKEEIVNGMKSFTSDGMEFKINYPEQLFAHDWKSDYQVQYNKIPPDSDHNIVQFFKNENLNGDKITILRYANVQRKTALDFTKTYWSARNENLTHWKPKDIDFVVETYKLPEINVEQKQYLTPLGDWMYVFKSDLGLEKELEKMMPTLQFTGTGEAFSKNLIPCPDNLLSTDAEIIEQANWQGKEDPCNSKPEHKICGYIRSIYDNGMKSFGNFNYKNHYCYCSFFNKDGYRKYRGTEMFALGYEEGVCQEIIK